MQKKLLLNNCCRKPIYAPNLLSVNVDCSYPGKIIILPITNVVVVIKSGSKSSDKFCIQLPDQVTNTKFITIRNLTTFSILIKSKDGIFDGRYGVRHVDPIKSRTFTFPYSTLFWCTID